MGGCSCSCCDRGKTKSTPSLTGLRLEFDNKFTKTLLCARNKSFDNKTRCKKTRKNNQLISFLVKIFSLKAKLENTLVI